MGREDMGDTPAAGNGRPGGKPWPSVMTLEILKDCPREILDLVTADANAKLQSQMEALTATNDRAVQFFVAMSAIESGVVGALSLAYFTTEAARIPLIVVAIGFFLALLLASYAFRPIEFASSGASPDGWAIPVRDKVCVDNLLRMQIMTLRDDIDTNSRALFDKNSAFQMAVGAAVCTLLISAATTTWEPPPPVAKPSGITFSIQLTD